jgi:hypothetical protein
VSAATQGHTPALDWQRHDAEHSAEGQSHAPLPWAVVGRDSGTIRTADGDYALVARVHWYRRKHNAALIVRAVNSHDALVEALKRTSRALREARGGIFNDAALADEAACAALSAAGIGGAK